MSFTFAVRPFPRSDELGLRSDGFLERGTSMRFRISVLAGKPAADENERVFTADNVTRPRKRSAAYLHGKFNSRRKGQYLHDVCTEGKAERFTKHNNSIDRLRELDSDGGL